MIGSLSPNLAGQGGLGPPGAGTSVQAEFHFNEPKLEDVSLENLDCGTGLQSGAVDEGAIGCSNLVPEEKRSLALLDDGVAAACGPLVVQRLEVDRRVKTGRRVESSDGCRAGRGEGCLHSGLVAHEAGLSRGGTPGLQNDLFLGFPLLNGRFGNTIKQCGSCFPEPEAQLSQHADGDFRVVLDQLIEGAAVDSNQGTVGDRSCGGRPGEVLENGHLSEKITFFEECQPEFLPIDSFENFDLAVLDDEHVGTVLTFVENPLSRTEAAGELVAANRLWGPGVGHVNPLSSVVVHSSSKSSPRSAVGQQVILGGFPW